MSSGHNPARAREMWNATRTAIILEEIKAIRNYVVVAEVPFVETQGFRVVEPKYLLSLYGVVHGSEQCFSVRIARRLIAQGINPVGRPEMADYSEFLHSGQLAEQTQKNF